MRSQVFSKLRLVLFVVLLVVGMLGVSTGYAQDTGAPAPAQKQGIFALILSHIDFVFVIIAVLSVMGVTLIIQGFIKNRRSVVMPEESVEQIRGIIAEAGSLAGPAKAQKFKELLEFTENDPSFISRALNPALKRAPSFASMKEAMETAIGEQTAEQFRKIEYLNIIGNLGPLLGLLGTVLGMIEAFQDLMAAGGQANPANLAGGISTALCHTFLGLMLAVPCLAAFGVLRTIVDRLTVQGALVAEELLLMIKPSEAKPAAPAAATARATPQPAVRKPAAPAPAQA